jgi:hypothetical protein
LFTTTYREIAMSDNMEKAKIDDGLSDNEKARYRDQRRKYRPDDLKTREEYSGNKGRPDAPVRNRKMRSGEHNENKLNLPETHEAIKEQGKYSVPAPGKAHKKTRGASDYLKDGVEIDKRKAAKDATTKRSQLSVVKKENLRIDEEEDGKYELEPGSEDLEKEKLKGGLGDGKKDSDFTSDQVAMGLKVEMEHTKDKAAAKEIVRDHLSEDPNYYSKLKTIEKTALQERWELLKTKLDNEKAILSITESMQPEQEEGGQDEEAPPEDNEQSPQDTGEVPEEDMGQEESPKTSEEQLSEEEMMRQQHTEELPDSEEGEEQPIDEEGQPEESAKEQPQQEGEDEEDPQELFKDEMLTMQMQNQGYSQAQIDYILHGHIPASATSEDIKMEADKAMSELKQVTAKQDQTQESQHRQELHDQNKEQRDASHSAKHEHQARMDELAYNKELMSMESEIEAEGVLSDKHHKHLNSEQDRYHSKRMMDLEYAHAQEDRHTNNMDVEHKKKILELEYAQAKRESELELEYKEEEMKLKLQQMKQSHADKTVHTQEAHKSKMAMQSETSKAKMADHKHGLKAKSNEKRDAAKTSEAERKGNG